MAERAIPCPDCDKTFASKANLAAHRRLAPDHARPAPESKAPAKPELSPDAIVDAAVENLRNDGALLAGTIAPHVGVAIHGVEGEHKGEWIVKSRAVMFGNLIRERARKDPRVVRFLLMFNHLHEVPESVELAASMATALAVDTGRLAPDQEVALTLMGREVKFAPARLAMGDVLDYVAANASMPPAEAPSANGQVGTVSEVVSGGVENT